ncbi:MAG: DUF309 domain-containing protein [Candidatus Poribacteria bacterium]|nr:DUF309 domain-containing protein [Candidatus Poribacteria bacterium]
MDTLKQPEPFDANWHRYCPQKPFPPYRHIPGVTPHPIRDPRGHSYRLEEEHDDDPLPPELWRENEDYLYGIDLYNFAYWWEAHEPWEGFSHQAEDTYRLFLQGLIQVSASLIKYHSRMLRPLRTLSTAGRDKLRQVVIECDDALGNYMGLDLPAFLEIADGFFAPFFADNVTEATYLQNAVKPLIRLTD